MQDYSQIKDSTHGCYPVLDSIIFCFDKCRVKYLGLRSEADIHFKKHFPDVVYQKFPEKLFYQTASYPRLYGVIDIEEGYRFKKAK